MSQFRSIISDYEVEKFKMLWRYGMVFISGNYGLQIDLSSNFGCVLVLCSYRRVL
jgi:hypothetical protein